VDTPGSQGIPQCGAAPALKTAAVVIPGYEIVRLLGQGGMGAAYEAIHKARRERVAVKVMMPSTLPTEHAMQLFLREASILSQLNHPGIVRFHEVSCSDGMLFIVMEYVDQVDLPALLAKCLLIERIRIVCGLVGQVLDALQFAHQRGLVHRDVKPTNILVANNGERLHAKLSDFGIAKNFETAGHSAMTRDGEIRGTLGFMAPEQLTDSRRVKPAADIYSVGVTFYYFLSGQLPFESSLPATDLTKAVNTAPIPLTRILPDLQEPLLKIVECAMAHDPAQRFASAAEMRTALLPFTSSGQD
jgi:serine/threonine-protein kinase